MDTPWAAWRDTIVAELSQAHPDLAGKTTRIDITRYGHAMAIPVPQTSDKNSLWPAWNMRKQLSKAEQSKGMQAAPRWERLSFAHSDWAGYSVFEEAFTLGHGAGSALPLAT
jgi:hypothetical protein